MHSVVEELELIALEVTRGGKTIVTDYVEPEEHVKCTIGLIYVTIMIILQMRGSLEGPRPYNVELVC